MNNAISRDDHLQFCKDRALAYLPQSPREALASMFSDLGKHPETAKHAAIELGMMLLVTGNLSSPGQAREFILGFN